MLFNSDILSTPLEGTGEERSKIKSIVSLIAFSLILVIVASILFSIIVGPYVVFNSEEGIRIENSVWPYYYIFFIGFQLALPFPVNIRLQFIAEWVVYLAIFTITFFSGALSFSNGFKKSLKDGIGSFLQNRLAATVSIFSITYLFIFVIDLIQTNAGISSGSLSFDNQAELLAYVTHGPIAEEIGFRMSIIGLFSLITIYGWKVKVDSLTYLLSPMPTLSHSIDTTKGKREVNLLYILLILSSALLFGVAHITPGSTWEIGKLTEATVAGIMLGIAYTYFGLAETILVHWLFNYYPTALVIFDEEVINTGVSSVIEILFLALGMIFVTSTVLRYISEYAKKK